mmetsp:Transcript_22492/g.53107  ORF Transcript_22492/g.53107 Transcript_22492/m.53107 type:complete len:633 (+) Transcript_22492:4323-6221(+)
MLRGDTTTLHVKVEDNARLGLITQGANRVYSPRPTTVDSDCDEDGDLCQAQLDVTVGKNATFVYAPDPCALYARSCFLQNQQVHVHPESSVALIDWFSSGRYMNNERWEFDQLCTRTRLEWMELDDNKDDDDDDDDGGGTNKKTIPFLQDTIAMDLRFSQLNDYGAHIGMNCFASLILYGKDVQPVVDRCLTLSDAFASQYTRVRSRGHFHDNDDDEDDDQQLMSSRTTSSGASSNDCFIDNVINVSGTSGQQRRVVMGVSEVPCPGKPSDACVVRFAATTNEDLYRVFHHLLLPMTDSFGMEFYKERIRAQTVNIPKMVEESTDETKGSTEKQASVDDTLKRKIRSGRKFVSPEIDGINTHSNRNDTSSETFWSTLMLADSSLPTGSFAHSAGLEAAAQLGLISNEQDVEDFIQAASRSTMQLVVPFLISGRDLATKSMMDDVDLTFQEDVQARLTNQWYKINQECQAVMCANGPACAASLDQGKSLARVASEWIKRSSTDTNFDDICPTVDQMVLNCLKSSKNETTHIGPTLGLVGGRLGLDDFQVCRLFAYCMARDIVSAAVRLSLVGPLASVSLLHKVQYAAEDGIQIVLPLMEDCRDSPLGASAASAPVVEAVQPCHESLQVRLFRS